MNQMTRIGLIREGKFPPDNRVALTPVQCKHLHKLFPHLKIIAQAADHRCFTDAEFKRAGIDVQDNLSDCDFILGIKEVPEQHLIPGKTYLFFSHTRKKQPHNQRLLKAILEKNITLIDYECLEHKDGQRIIGFGFFAGVVGAHNGMMAFGKRTGLFELDRVYRQKNLKQLIRTYFGLDLPEIKIAVTGSGRVAHGILEIMNLMDIIEVEKDEYVARDFTYPVYVQLKGPDLYRHKLKGNYNREEFHLHAEDYECIFDQFIPHTDILMNGTFWDPSIARLFDATQISRPDFRIQVIADVTDDHNGSVPINLGDQTIDEPVYGVDKKTLKKTLPYLTDSVDIMAVGNLPNELPRDASEYFGEQLIKYVLADLLSESSEIIEKATIVKKGKLTEKFRYLEEYAGSNGIL